MKFCRAWGMTWLLAIAPQWTAVSLASDAPDWVQAVVAVPTPPSAAGANAVVLLDEQHVVVPKRGRIVTTCRGAIRVLTRVGQKHATCSVNYTQDTESVRQFQSWLIHPNGAVTRGHRKDALDYSLGGAGTLYSDQRALVLRAEDPPVGSVYAWQYERDEEPLIAHWKWGFESDLPTCHSRFRMTLPDGLTPRVVKTGADLFRETREADTWTWESTNRPAATAEPLAPLSWREDVGLDLEVRGVDSVTAAGRSFNDWRDVAVWVDRLAAPRAIVTPEIERHARSIAATGSDTIARLAALAGDVQSLNYVAIELGLGRGHGYRPNFASEVLRLGYGDCKDKANLLRTLLRAEGHEAWLMPVYFGNRSRIEPEWPSPRQFNHCIVAMRVPRDTRLSAVFEHPELGTLLAFDPTDPLTVFGDLPQSEQGSLAMLVDSRAGGLVRLPIAESGTNRWTLRVEATLNEDGLLAASLIERSVGQAAVGERRLRRQETEAGYRQTIEDWLARNGGGVKLERLEAHEDSLAGRFELRVDYESPRFARNVQGRMLTFRPALTSARRSIHLPDSTRTGAVALEPECVAETVLVKLPERFELDEQPESIERKTDFGSFAATWQAENGILRFIRNWQLRPVLLPAERYPDVLAMYADIARSSQASVVLVRK